MERSRRTSQFEAGKIAENYIIFIYSQYEIDFPWPAHDLLKQKILSRFGLFRAFEIQPKKT
jgi:hypothetical protein